MSIIQLDEARREHVGGSEAAAACGVDPYRSRVMLWAEKTGRIARAESEAMTWGKRLEPVIVAALENEGYETIPAPADGFTVPGVPWLTGHPDGFVTLDGARAVLEVKTAGQWTGGEWKTDARAPLPYIVQCLHYMALTGCDAALLACLVAGQRLEVRTVYRDEKAVERMLGLEEEFLRFVRSDRPPPPDGSESTRDAIRELFPSSSGGTIRLTGELWQTYLELRRREEQLREVERQRDELKQRLQLAMGDADTAVSPHDTTACKWTTYKTTRLDTAALREQRPDIYAEYSETKTLRRFTVE